MKMSFRIVTIGGFLVVLAVVIVAVFAPAIINRPTQTLIAHPYTEQQTRGRVIFYSNGCNYCHTQYVRAEDNAAGPISSGGDYAYDNPMILGSERTGPDLSYIGRKRSEAWEKQHWKDPRALSPLSIMPRFNYLTDAQLDDLAAYVFNLGDRVAQERMIQAPTAYVYALDPIVSPKVTPPADPNANVGWPAWTAANLQAGKETYIDRCQTCHGCSGNGLGTYGGTVIVTPVNYKQEPFRSMKDDEWFWHVSEGVQGTVMPPWKESMTVDERWNAIRYIQTTFAHPVMRDPAEGDPVGPYANLTNPVKNSLDVIDQGKHIFVRECLVCHGDAATGKGPYGDNLQPSPPDFSDQGHYGTLQNPLFTDSDYFWRISEGLPWSAMPVWKLQYSEDERWSLVHYIRSIFTQTEKAPAQPPTGQDFDFPDIIKQQVMPASANYEYGQKYFIEHCAHCHGFAGDGSGAEGQYLNPKPFDFRLWAGKNADQEFTAEVFAKVSFGIKGSAMPSWSEFLTDGQRWDDVKYVIDTFVKGKPVTTSQFGNGAYSANFASLSQADWTDEGHVIDTGNGQKLYGDMCVSCHGDKGDGNGPGVQGNASKGPAPFPKGMTQTYVFATIYDGVPNSAMPPFGWLVAYHWKLKDSDIWDLTAYVDALTGAQTQSQ